MTSNFVGSAFLAFELVSGLLFKCENHEYFANDTHIQEASVELQWRETDLGFRLVITFQTCAMTSTALAKGFSTFFYYLKLLLRIKTALYGFSETSHC